MIAVARSGRSFMSLSLIAFQPAIEEPSNMVPSVRKSSSTRSMSKVTCCIWPRMSVKRTSTYLTSFSLICARMSAAVVMVSVPFEVSRSWWWSDGVGSGFSRPDAHDVEDVGDEDLAVADAACAGGCGDGFEGAGELVVGDDHLDLDLGKEVHDVLGAAVELGLALLAPVALGLDDSHALHAQLLQGLLHLVELERLDDGFDLFHRSSDAPPPTGLLAVAAT